MKKRRIVIVAFMLATVLVLGVGYAAVSGVLDIRGTGTFMGKNLAQNEILEAVKFTAAEGDDECTAKIIEDGVGRTAKMDVGFNDTTATAQTFSASAKFTVTYASEDASAIFPDVKLTLPTPTITPALAGDTNWAISVDWAGDQTLALGESVDIIVTVTYELTDPTAVQDSELTANISVAIPFATVA